MVRERVCVRERETDWVDCGVDSYIDRQRANIVVEKLSLGWTLDKYVHCKGTADFVRRVG